MARTMKHAGCDWTEVEGGEKNQWMCDFKGTRVDVYSDYSEATWDVMFNEEGCYSLKATDLESAMKEAIHDLIC